MDVIKVAVSTPIRENLNTIHDRLYGSDGGLIHSWELGRRLFEKGHVDSQAALRGELPMCSVKGGVDRPLKVKKKLGSFFYLAYWQGLRGEDLDLNLKSEPSLTCPVHGVTVTFTSDLDKLCPPELD